MPKSYAHSSKQCIQQLAVDSYACMVGGVVGLLGEVDSTIHHTSFDSLKEKLTKEWDKIPQRVLRDYCTTSPPACSKLSMLRDATSNRMFTFSLLYIIIYIYNSICYERPKTQSH